MNLIGKQTIIVIKTIIVIQSIGNCVIESNKRETANVSSFPFLAFVDGENSMNKYLRMVNKVISKERDIN